MQLNQAVVFTKPLHHLGLNLSPEMLDQLARRFFEQNGFNFIRTKKFTGPELASRDAIRKHYIMYSRAALADPLELTKSGREKFSSAFGRSWNEEVAAGKILPINQLLNDKGLDVHQIFKFWNALFSEGKTAKIQDGVIMAYCEEINAYLVNAFYPSMQANFYHPETVMYYYVVEFDPQTVSWLDFRKKVLGATNSSNAVHESFRGQLYSEYPVEFPGRDNFVHGSAGPFEGFVERAIHESDFDMTSNPIGRYLSARGLDLDAFAAWKAQQSVTDLGNLFDATEEKNTDDILETLDGVAF